MKQRAWVTVHVRMYEFLGGVAKIHVPDNCKNAVARDGGFKDR